MKAIIFCGGEGTRLRPLTASIPKPMVDINGRTILEHIFDLLKKYNVREVILTTCYLKEKIRQHYGNGEKYGLKIDYIEEDVLMGTANHIGLAKGYLSETFIVANGDELKEIELDEMLKQHKKTRAIATIAIREVPDPSPYGTVRLEGKKITEFIEKPKKEEAPSNFVSAGLYIFEPEVLRYIPEDYTMLEQVVFPRLAREGKLYGYKFKGAWFDTGTFERLESARKNWRGIK